MLVVFSAFAPSPPPVSLVGKARGKTNRQGNIGRQLPSASDLIFPKVLLCEPDVLVIKRLFFF